MHRSTSKNTATTYKCDFKLSYKKQILAKGLTSNANRSQEQQHRQLILLGGDIIPQITFAGVERI